MITARILLDSMHPEIDSRVTTWLLVYHRFIHSEFLTHRMFSRNSMSSRAIPWEKTVKLIRANPAVPVAWTSEKKGMQGGDLVPDDVAALNDEDWHLAASLMIEIAERMGRRGTHKSRVNRLLEPFVFMHTILTATEYDNFFALRDNPLAEPEFQVLARLMHDEYDRSEPTVLGEDDWHLPMVAGDGYDLVTLKTEFEFTWLDVAKACSVARCCRVSYLTHDTGKRDVDKDLDRFVSLVYPEQGPMHASPFEHVCYPAWPHRLPGNLRGFRQYRHDVEGDLRLGRDPLQGLPLGERNPRVAKQAR